MLYICVHDDVLWHQPCIYFIGTVSEHTGKIGMGTTFVHALPNVHCCVEIKYCHSDVYSTLTTSLRTSDGQQVRKRLKTVCI